MISSPTVLGSPLLKTQHFIGASRWELASPTKAVGYHQLRVPHQKYVGDGKGNLVKGEDGSELNGKNGLGEVEFKGHAHGSNVHWYEKTEDGVWKFAGLKPEIRWGEFEFERIFETGRSEHGVEDGKKEAEVHGNGVANGAMTGEEKKAEQEKIEAGKIMGGVDASPQATTALNKEHHVNGTTKAVPSTQDHQTLNTENDATAGAQAAPTLNPIPTNAPAAEPSTPSPALTSTSTAPSPTSPTSPIIASEVANDPSYQTAMIQEKKDQLYEKEEAKAAADEVQMYAGAMADGLDHLGPAAGVDGQAIGVAA